MPSTRTFDPNRVTVSLFGAPIGSGFAEDSKVKIERPTADWTFKEGVDGEITRSKTNSKLTKFTLYLMQSSPYNAILDKVRKEDQSNNDGIGPCFVASLDGAFDVFMAAGSIEGPPKEVEIGREVKVNEWVIIGAETSRTDAAP